MWDSILRDVYFSFGGLLMKLSGEAEKMKDFDLDNRFYLLISKVKEARGKREGQRVKEEVDLE